MSGWTLKERCCRRRAGSFRNHMLVEQKDSDGFKQFPLRNQTHFVHQFADGDHICFERTERC